MKDSNKFMSSLFPPNTEGNLSAGEKASRTVLLVFFTLYVMSLMSTNSGMEIFSWALGAGTLVHGFLFRRHFVFWRLPKGNVLVLTFVLVAALGICLGPTAHIMEKIYDLGRLRFFGLYFLLFFYFRWAAPDPRYLIKVMIFATLIVGVYALCQHFIPLDLVRPMGKKIIIFTNPVAQTDPLVLGTFNHHLTFASVYLFPTLIFLSLGFLDPKWRKIIPLGLLLLLDCFWTQSRTLWVSLPFCLGLIALARGRKFALITFGAAAVVMITVVLTVPTLKERISRTFFSPVEGQTYSTRADLWKMQWRIFLEHPVLGVGWDNNERFCKEFAKRFYPEKTDFACGHAHSNLLQILATTGFTGLVLFLGIWISFFRRLWQTRQRIGEDPFEKALLWGVFVALFGFHFQGLTQWNFGDCEVLHNVVFFWAFGDAAYRRYVT